MCTTRGSHHASAKLVRTYCVIMQNWNWLTGWTWLTDLTGLDGSSYDICSLLVWRGERKKRKRKEKKEKNRIGKKSTGKPGLESNRPNTNP